MKTILICGYREWSKKIYKKLDFNYKSVVNLVYVDDKDELEKNINQFNPSAIFFIGWSWIIPDEIVKKYVCLCLHPSLLPRYRGGSPVQNQIVNGEQISGVTIFRMDEGIDTGNILFQEEISLKNNLVDIYDRIIHKGTKGFSKLIEDIKNNSLSNGTEQDEIDASFYKRRTPKMSEIKIEDFSKFTAEQLYDKIRALQDPYPNAFVICKDNTKLYLTHSKTEEKL